MIPLPVRVAVNVVVVSLGFFAGWTLFSVPLTLVGAPFHMLSIAAVSGLAVAISAFWFLRTPIGNLLATPISWPVNDPMPQGRSRWLWVGAGILVALATIFFIPTSNASPLWLVLVTVAVVALIQPSSQLDYQPTTRASTMAWLEMALLIIGTIALYIVIFRPDADDAFYLNLPIGLKSAPGGMMLTDTMYGVSNWPILGSNYRVESLPTLLAATSSVTGLSVVHVSHLLLPVTWCVILVCTNMIIGHGLFGRHWWVFATIFLVASMVIAGNLQNWGVHGISRLFHGKGPLLMIVLPLIAYTVARAESAKFPITQSIIVLSGLSIAALGLTANAIYLAPLTLGMSIVAARIVLRDFSLPRVSVLIASIGPLAAGLWLFFLDPPTSAQHVNEHQLLDLSFWGMASTKISLGILVATLGSALFASRLGWGGRWVTAYLLCFLVFVANPILWPLYDRLVTGGLNFRLWWSLPVPLFLSLCITWAVIYSKRVYLSTSVVVVVLTLLSFLPTGLIGMTGTTIDPSIEKIPRVPTMVIDKVRDVATPESVVLAPEEIAEWLPVRENHPAIVYTRRLYLRQSEPVVDPTRLQPRALLADWIAGDDAEPDAIIEAIKRLRVSIVVTQEDGALASIEDVWSEFDVQRTASLHGYVIWKVQATDGYRAG
ncbi:MAG: DUF6077 domain-containing protein [Pseudomonadota bacterium]